MTLIEIYTLGVISVLALATFGACATLGYYGTRHYTINPWFTCMVTIFLVIAPTFLMWVFILITGNIPYGAVIITMAVAVTVYSYTTRLVLQKLQCRHPMLVLLASTTAVWSAMYVAAYLIVPTQN